MTLSELRYVTALARSGHFGRAAEHCHISQPALSLAVRKLEQELGVSLFERGQKHISVTAAAAPLLIQAQRVLDEAARLRHMASEAQDPLRGSLRLGVIYTAGPYLLPSLIPALHRLAPHMPLEIEENTTETLGRKLAGGELDLLILALPFIAPGVHTRALYDERFAVLVPNEHTWARRKSVAPRELAAERVLLLEAGHCFANQVLEACPHLQRRADNTQHGNSLETIRGMVASGSGISVLPESACAAPWRSRLLKVVPFTRPAPARRMALVWRQGYGRRAAIDALRHAAQSLRLPGTTAVRAADATHRTLPGASSAAQRGSIQ